MRSAINEVLGQLAEASEERDRLAGDVARLQDTERSLQAELNRVSAANQSVRVRAGNASHPPRPNCDHGVAN